MSAGPSIILHKGDIRSHVSDRESAPALRFLGWFGSSMSPLYTEGDLEGTPVSFSPSRAQAAMFPGMVLDVIAHLQLHSIVNP